MSLVPFPVQAFCSFEALPVFLNSQESSCLSWSTDFPCSCLMVALSLCLCQESSFSFMLVAYTQQKIVVASKQPGDTVNLGENCKGSWGTS